MSGEIAELEARIQALSVEERVELMRILIADLDGVADANVESAWLEEAQRRQQQLTERKVQGVLGERVFENLRSCISILFGGRVRPNHLCNCRNLTR